MGTSCGYQTVQIDNALANGTLESTVMSLIADDVI